MTWSRADSCAKAGHRQQKAGAVASKESWPVQLPAILECLGREDPAEILSDLSSRRPCHPRLQVRSSRAATGPRTTREGMGEGEGHTGGFCRCNSCITSGYPYCTGPPSRSQGPQGPPLGPDTDHLPWLQAHPASDTFLSSPYPVTQPLAVLKIFMGLYLALTRQQDP